MSSGASVKASLLFVQKFTEREQADFDVKQEKVRADIEKKYANTITEATQRLEHAISVASEAGNSTEKKSLQRELVDYQKQMADRIASETRSSAEDTLPVSHFPLRGGKSRHHRNGGSRPERAIPKHQSTPQSNQHVSRTLPRFPTRPKAVSPGQGGSMTEGVLANQRAGAVWWKDLDRWNVRTGRGSAWRWPSTFSVCDFRAM